MQLCKLRGPGGTPRVGIVDVGVVTVLPESAPTLTEILDSLDPADTAGRLAQMATALSYDKTPLLAPIDRQEVWAAGVTYKRSRRARMEESQDASSFYEKVYEAPRPELFLKATPHRVVGPGQPIRIRADTTWSVPEPEITLVLTQDLRIAGYTIGNDMSARDIEGENPLYLPQAKVYDQCAALGPVITLAGDFPPKEEVSITLVIRRQAEEVFRGQTRLSELHRSFEELVGWLGRDNSFPHGAFLMTGTGIVPPDHFSLEPGDMVSITIDGIGTLENPVVQARR